MAVEEGIDAVSPVTRKNDEKEDAVVVEVDSEASDGDVERKHYSKLSVWLMVLYSGLAIGSDG